MIGAYLVVGGVLTMVVGYISLMHYIIMRTERRDLAALAGARSKPVAHTTETVSVKVPNALLRGFDDRNGRPANR